METPKKKKKKEKRAAEVEEPEEESTVTEVISGYLSKNKKKTRHLPFKKKNHFEVLINPFSAVNRKEEKKEEKGQGWRRWWMNKWHLYIFSVLVFM